MTQKDKSSRWCFTINNYLDDDLADFDTWDALYKCYGIEEGEEGTPHMQGYIVLKGQQRLSAMKKLHKKAHWETAKGTTEQNIEYCSKDGDFYELGDRPITKAAAGQIEKARWENAWAAAIEGRLMDVDADIRVRCYNTLKVIAKDHMIKPDDADDVTGIWFYGGPGTGKSRKAREDYPGAYLKMQNKWWDGYQNEDYVILDDFDSKELGHLLKIWTDRYSFLAETKGGAIAIRPKKIIITSNYHPDHFEWDDEMKEAIKRRMKITHFTNGPFAPR